MKYKVNGRIVDAKDPVEAVKKVRDASFDVKLHKVKSIAKDLGIKERDIDVDEDYEEITVTSTSDKLNLLKQNLAGQGIKASQGATANTLYIADSVKDAHLKQWWASIDYSDDFKMLKSLGISARPISQHADETMYEFTGSKDAFAKAKKIGYFLDVDVNSLTDSDPDWNKELEDALNDIKKPTASDALTVLKYLQNHIKSKSNVTTGKQNTSFGFVDLWVSRGIKLVCSFNAESVDVTIPDADADNIDRLDGDDIMKYLMTGYNDAVINAKRKDRAEAKTVEPKQLSSDMENKLRSIMIKLAKKYDIKGNLKEGKIWPGRNFYTHEPYITFNGANFYVDPSQLNQFEREVNQYVKSIGFAAKVLAKRTGGIDQINLTSLKDSFDDGCHNTRDAEGVDYQLLIDDELETIAAYEEQIKNTDDEDVIKVLKHIIEEEQQHVGELEALRGSEEQ